MDIMQYLQNPFHLNWVVFGEAVHWPSMPQPASWLTVTGTLPYNTFPNDFGLGRSVLLAGRLTEDTELQS